MMKRATVATLMILTVPVDGRTEALSIWMQHSTVDQTTNQKSVSVNTLSVDTHSCGSKPEPAMLSVDCKKGETGFSILTGCPVDSDDYGYSGVIELRLDDGPIRKIRARLTKDRDFFDVRGAKRLVQNMFGHDTLTVRASARFDPPIVATFDISDIRVATEPVRKLCGW